MNNKIDISYLNSSSKERHLLIDSIGFDVFLEPQKKVFIRYKIIENFDFLKGSISTSVLELFSKEFSRLSIPEMEFKISFVSVDNSVVFSIFAGFKLNNETSEFISLFFSSYVEIKTCDSFSTFVSTLSTLKVSSYSKSLKP